MAFTDDNAIDFYSIRNFASLGIVVICKRQAFEQTLPEHFH